MRTRYALLLALVPVGILIACQNDDSSNPPSPAADGGVKLDGAKSNDDGSVTPEVDSGPKPVTVLVKRHGAPLAGVTVVYQDAAGAVIAPVTTDATGIATRVVAAGSQVTVVLGTAAASRLLTITEVEPGDTLTAVDEDRDVGVPNITITGFPANPPLGGTVTAHAGTRCSGDPFVEAPQTLGMSYDCQADGTFPVLLIANKPNALLFGEAGFAFKKGNKYTGADAGFQPVDVAVDGAWSTTFADHKIALTNGPDGTFGNTVMSEIANGVPYVGEEIQFSFDGNTTVENHHSGHPGYPDSIQSEGSLIVNYKGPIGVQVLAVNEAAPAGDATTTLDFATLLPQIRDTEITTDTPDRPTVTWDGTASDGGPATFDGADGTYVVMQWTTQTGGDSFTSGTWTFVTPGNKKTVKAPALPAELSAYAPPASDAADATQFNRPPSVIVLDASFVPDYRAFRQVSGALPASAATGWANHGGNFVPPLPSAGSLRATALVR